MHKSIRWILFLILLSGLTTLACGLFTNDEEPTAEPTTQAVKGSGDESNSSIEDASSDSNQETGSDIAPDQSDEESSNDEPAFQSVENIDLSAVDLSLNFDSYKLTMDMAFNGNDINGKAVTQTLFAEISYVADPLAMGMIMSGEGIEGAEGFEEINMAQIDGTSYVVFPGLGCISSGVTGTDLLDENPFGDVVNPETFLDEIDRATRIGEETVNGISSIHYTFDESAMKNQGDFEEAEGHLYIAKEGNFLVRMTLDGEGDIDLLDQGSNQKGTIHLELNITDINQSIEIQLPPGCEEGSSSGVELPMLDDAFETSSFSGFFSYRSNASVEEAVAFYQEALPAEGWIFLEDESFASSGILAYEKENQSIDLMISADSSGEGISVSIFSEDSGE